MKNLADDCKPTPLTDQLVHTLRTSGYGFSYECMTKHARGLECKLAAAEERISELIAEIAQLQADNIDLIVERD